MLKNYLWEIFEVAQEERTDGDNLTGDMEIAPNLFVEGIKGNPQHQYKALAEIDVPAAKAKWEALDAAGQAKEYDEVGKIIDRNYKALCTAFAEGNREKFRAIVLFNS
ncbi:MAG TPA: hypothetical protein IAA83_05325 [Candidatus Avoscillospira avistercoris]|uniref:Uncharacterized protein n=1 Tax=Candidatus Avoscillospira avistercoris TaxID=2840707 RepID=A0A9D1JT33_9FIRM|nr:hypothetical protein [Candidatus Avoscillospira avistercoris]